MLPIEDGKASTKQQVADAIDAVFCRNDGCFHPTFLRTNPLFGGYIKNLGPSNANFITSLTLNGNFLSQKQRIGFARTLPIYTVLLDEICPNLRKMTLILSGPGKIIYWRGIGYSPDRKDFMQYLDKIETTLERLVHGLSGLGCLSLEAEDETNEDWSAFSKWVDFVEARAREKRLGLDRVLDSEEEQRNEYCEESVTDTYWTIRTV